MDDVALCQVYEHVINPDKLRTRISEGERRVTSKNRRTAIDRREHLFTMELAQCTWHQRARA
jgi:hypothetical protein